MTNIDALVALVRAAATSATEHQEQFAAEDVEARKIVDIMEQFLRIKGRVVYGGAAINAHLSNENKFYDPNLYLPDYDFLTPDPLQDCADLIVAFQSEGFTDVEAKFGIHEGTYKIFVNFRAAADITFMPADIYSRIVSDSDTIEGIRYASVNYLRMNIYLELSRPAGMVSRWEKIYKRLLLLNAEHPVSGGPGRCSANPLAAKGDANPIFDELVQAGIANEAIFLNGVETLEKEELSESGVVLMITPAREKLVDYLMNKHGLTRTDIPALGELLPARSEIRLERELVAVIFDTVACHSYTVLTEPVGYRLGSIDLLIQMYYAFYFTELDEYFPTRLLCVIQRLIEHEQEDRTRAAAERAVPSTVFPLDCVGHQPSMPELKRAHRERVREKQKELVRIKKTRKQRRVRD